MRIALHDYAGHPFQIELSRELARRGHEVRHFYFASDVTPRGPLAPRGDDPPGLTIEGLDIDRPFDKLSYWKRIFYNREYGAVAATRIRAFAPDILISANVPIDALDIVHRGCSSADAAPRRIVWLQDVFSTGVRKVLRKKLPAVGELVAWRYDRLERSVMRGADHVVAITEDFVPLLEGWGVPKARVSVIENWAPLGEITPLPADNAWAREQGLVGRKVLLYSGTLGLKHDPAGIAALARALHDQPDAVVVVVSQGAGAEWLAAAKAEGGLDNLLLLPFQPFERFSEVLATASIVLAVIEADAGIFSVPSKVLSYLSAGRPILMAVPQENLASRTVLRAEAGLCVPPGDQDGFVAAARRLLQDEGLRERYARNARAHAERHFAIDVIADRFEAVWRDDTPPSRLSAA